jgi:hypothetical protein
MSHKVVYKSSLPRMPGAYPQHRGHDSQDSDSDTDSADKEAPRGSESPTRPSTLQPDKDVDALSSELQKLRPISLPVRNPATAQDNGPDPQHAPGLEPFRTQNFASLPTSDFSFMVSRAKSASSGGPPTTDFRNIFSQPKPGLLPTFFFEQVTTPSTGPSALAKPGEENSLFVDFTKGTPVHVSPDASTSGGQGDRLFEERKPQVLYGGTTPPLQIRSKYNVSTLFGPDVRLEPIPDGTAITGSDPQTQGTSSKRQAGHLSSANEPTNDDGSTGKRLFGQGRCSMAQMIAPTAAEPTVPNRYVPTPPRTIEKSQPTFSSAEHFVAYTKGCIHLNTDDISAFTTELRSLYGQIVALTKDVGTSATEIHRMKEIIPLIDCELEKWAQSHAKNKSSAPPLTTSDLGRTGTSLQEEKTMVQNQLHLEELNLRSLQNDLLMRVITTLKSVAENVWIGREIVGSQENTVQQMENSANVLNLKNLNLEATLDSTQRKMKWLESENEKWMQGMEDARLVHSAALKDARSKHAREQDSALTELKVKYARQIADADAKLRTHKKAMVYNDELQETIRNLEREKSSLVLAKAAVEKELQDLKNEVAELRSYKEGYGQIESKRNEFERMYNDAEVELEGLRRARDAQPDAQISQHLAALAPLAAYSNAGALKSHTEDLDLLEKYWSRQRNFTELAARSTAAELAGVEAQLIEIRRHLRLLQGPDEDSEESDSDEDSSEPDDESDDAPQPAGEDAQTLLLDTLAQPLRAGVAAAPSSGLQPAGSSQQPQTWANKAGTAPQHHTVDRAYTHVSYQGAGVSTVKEIRAPDSDGWQKVTRR